MKFTKLTSLSLSGIFNLIDNYNLGMHIYIYIYIYICRKIIILGGKDAHSEETRVECKSNKEPYLLKSKERNTVESLQNIQSIKLPSALTITME